jgi:hypothetical protein
MTGYAGPRCGSRRIEAFMGARRPKSSSQQTPSWRKRDSKSRSRSQTGALGERQSMAGVCERSACGWDQEFESPLLQRRVRCEPVWSALSSGSMALRG